MSNDEARRALGGEGGEGTHKTPIGAAAAYVREHHHNNIDPSLTRPQALQNDLYQNVPAQANGLGTRPPNGVANETISIMCGPLLNYKRMSEEHTEQPTWHGSVLIVTAPNQSPKNLRLRRATTHSLHVNSIGNTNGDTDGTAVTGEKEFKGTRLFEDPRKAFWQFSIHVPFEEQETTWEYLIPGMQAASDIDRAGLSDFKRFTVPSRHESMRLMFHSCNGFSIGTDEEAWSGPALWNDVNRMHAKQPFHVMIGGGDQIYNDNVRVTGPLREWTDIGNPRKRRDFPFNENMRAQCDDFYFNNYIKWYSAEPFATANARIPQINIWDDHDIIDGFGSYTDHFMQCAVFRGIGGVAHKYYLLFQHHIPPPVSTFTTDAPQTFHSTGTTAPDPVQLKDTFVLTNAPEDPSFIIGRRPGPYVEEKSRSVYCQLGKRIAFLGLDGRTERTRHQINYPGTYDQIFSLVANKLAASNGVLKHLVVLLGVPIAYPRLQWLENILKSPIIGPIRFLNKRFGLAGGFFNQFDGNVDLLDDLDDHYTAHQHKKERRELVQQLQNLAKKYNVRVSILSGDVHLGAVGRFFSESKLNIPSEKDWRYMPNIISSAITNKPPPQAVANLLYRRNKVHHLDHDTDETLLELFDKDPGAGDPKIKAKTAESNHFTMPSRNYAILAESHPRRLPAANPDSQTNGVNGVIPKEEMDFVASNNPRQALHPGEIGAGTAHPAADGLTPSSRAGIDGMDVTLRVEIDPSDREGHTQGYGFSFPGLDCAGFKAQGERW